VNISTFVGVRYSGFSFNSKSTDNKYLSFITLVSLFGMALGVIALIVVVSVMNGFDTELKRRILGVVPHVIVSREIHAQDLVDDERVIAVAPFMSRSALLLDGNNSQLVMLNGIDASKEHEMSIIPDNMTEGSIEDLGGSPHGLIIGRPLAYRLGVMVGDMLTMVIPEPSLKGNSISPRVTRVQLVGTFELDAQLDYGLALMNYQELQRIVESPSVDTRFKLANVFEAPKVSVDYASYYEATTRDWTEQYGDFFETVKMEKVMMFVLLLLIVAIAAFNIVSSLSMMVKDKQRDIAVLRTFGLSPGGVMKIFVIQGAVIGVIGILTGTVLGLLLAHNITEVVGYFESLFGTRLLAGTYFDSVPSDVRYEDVLVIVIMTFAISVLATLYPAKRAANLRPATVLKEE
jgi:lipoprotein-releasing system permease protein